VGRIVGFALTIGLVASAGLVSPPSAQAASTPSPSAAVTGRGIAASKAPAAAGTAPTTVAPTAAPTSTPPTPQPTLVTTITSDQASPSLSRAAAFTFRANQAGARFRCRLLGPGHTSTAFTACPTTGGTASTTTGATSYSGLAPSPQKYTFAVRAVTPAVPAAGRADAYSWRVYSAFSPAHYSPPGGARFNNPLGRRAAQRHNLAHVIATINSMPGYKQATQGAPCPARTSLWPGRIRISLYSMTDRSFSAAARAANRRCISVQILMNNHLSAVTDVAWRLLEQSLGTRVFRGAQPRRSFAHRCSFGCRGHGVLHTKMYLFDSTLPAPARGSNRITKTVMVGSSNITSNASRVQWNDLYTLRGNGRVHADYLQMFNLMKTGRKSSRLVTFFEGLYSSVFWPQGSATDPYRRWLGAVRCTGASGGAGIGGRTVVYVNMHAWFGTRGLGLARQIRGMYNRGCYVRVLYSFMSFQVFTILHRRTGARMSVRRTAFSHNGQTAYVYSHLKNIDISGHFGRDPSTWLVSTGSNNFTNGGTRFDEVALRIRSRAAYNAYVRRFKFISARRSSPIYANFSEPRGGGRAP